MGVTMPDEFLSGRLLLDPSDRAAEVLFGLVMVLTTTCSFSISGGEGTDVRQMMTGALGCNFAWGIIDAVMYWMARVREREDKVAVLLAVRNAADPNDACRTIAGAMPPILASVSSPDQLEAMRQRLTQLPEPLEHLHLTKSDWRAGFRIFLLVFGATLPVVIPFMLVRDAKLALRISNAIAIAMLFVTGYVFAKSAKYHVVRNHPWRMGFAMVVIGCAMVALTIALGG
jgi:hypothetical protein